MIRQQLDVSLQEIQDYQQLAVEWLQLESQADCSVFLSWQWLSIWLSTYKPNVMLMRVLSGDELVGLAILCCRAERRHLFVGSRVLRLHQTGVDIEDQIWIEYNGLLVKRGLSASVEQAVLEFLHNQWTAWDEIVLTGIDMQQALRWQQHSRYNARLSWQAACFGVDLYKLRQSQQSFLSSLSANCRYQINRSKRRYQQAGLLRLEKPTCNEQAQQWFDAIGPWHIERWGSAAGQSGFSNPAFVAFHHAMLAEYWPKQQVELLALMVGEAHLATFYHLRYRDRIYFYLAGFKPEQDNQLKPGLVGHSLCIEHYCQQGLLFYDFMAGDERYKRQLAQQHGELCQLWLQKSQTDFWLESMARKTKRKLSTLFGAISSQ